LANTSTGTLDAFTSLVLTIVKPAAVSFYFLPAHDPVHAVRELAKFVGSVLSRRLDVGETREENPLKTKQGVW